MPLDQKRPLLNKKEDTALSKEKAARRKEVAARIEEDAARKQVKAAKSREGCQIKRGCCSEINTEQSAQVRKWKWRGRRQETAGSLKIP
jgi:hypothetical protein